LVYHFDAAAKLVDKVGSSPSLNSTGGYPPKESFFGRLKCELTHHWTRPPRAHARRELFEYLERALAAVDAAGVDPRSLEASAAALLRSWDRRADSGNRATALAILTLYPLIQARHDGRPDPDPRASLSAATAMLMRRHGRLDPPWSWVNRMRRGAVARGVDGAQDVLHAVEGPLERGRVAADSGDGLMFLVSFGQDGVRSESLHQYGSATSRPKSPHYADQVPLFVAHQLKPVWLDESEIRAHLEREYRPGEELDAAAR
jgi:penicillin amidase/acyl-homoserine-lactone acylase